MCVKSVGLFSSRAFLSDSIPYVVTGKLLFCEFDKINVGYLLIIKEYQIMMKSERDSLMF